MAWDTPATKPPAKSLFEVLAEWEKASADLEEVKPREMVLRKQVMTMAWQQPKLGTNDYPLANGYVLKGQHKITRKLVIPNNFVAPHPEKPATIVDAIDNLVERLRRCDNEGGFVAERLIKWTPTLVDSEYNSLSEKHKAIVDEFVESKVGTPTIEIKAPKE